jgi:hypothetical protein
MQKLKQTNLRQNLSQRQHPEFLPLESLMLNQPNVRPYQWSL